MQGEVSSCSLTALLSVHAALSSLWAASVYSSLSDCSLSVYMIWRKLTRSFFPFSPPAISRAEPFFFQLFHWIFHNCDRIQLSFYFFMVKYGYQDKLFYNSGRIKGGIQNAAAAKEGIAGQSPGAVPACGRHRPQSRPAPPGFPTRAGGAGRVHPGSGAAPAPDCAPSGRAAGSWWPGSGGSGRPSWPD